MTRESLLNILDSLGDLESPNLDVMNLTADEAIDYARDYGLEFEIEQEIESGATPAQALKEWDIIPKW